MIWEPARQATTVTRCLALCIDSRLSFSVSNHAGGPPATTCQVGHVARDDPAKVLGQPELQVWVGPRLLAAADGLDDPHVQIAVCRTRSHLASECEPARLRGNGRWHRASGLRPHRSGTAIPFAGRDQS